VTVAAALRVSNLRVAYAGVHAVSGIDLDVAEGACTAIIGANGAGKTSLLRGISGLVSARSDGIWLVDQRIDGKSPEARARLGLGHVLEGRHIFPGLTVRENLELGQMRVHRDELNARLDSMYQLFPDLKARSAVAAGGLSGGQQQFLAIARAMIGMPAVLLLDEPTLGLAPRLVDHVAEVILTLVSGGMTVLLVEQSLEVVQRAASVVHMQSHGHIVHSTTSASDDLMSKAHEVYLA
jgi:ABC-type branched-subunit amino acid transport system ATPase component